MNTLTTLRFVIPIRRLGCGFLVWAWLLILPTLLPAQEATATPPPVSPADAPELVEVDWLEELYKGGMTVVALGIVSIALVTFTLERWLTLRASRFVPRALPAAITPLFREGRYDEILAACRQRPSVFSDVAIHMVRFRHIDRSLLLSGAGDIGARAIVDQEQKCVPLAAIAGIAPLLGLLGTMIGMIEAFKLVEVFGDEGGASLLAGSISKALITTAVGLILAIPALVVYYWAKGRVHKAGKAIETESEALFNAWFLEPENHDTPHAIHAGREPAAEALPSHP